MKYTKAQIKIFLAQKTDKEVLSLFQGKHPVDYFEDYLDYMCGSKEDIQKVLDIFIQAAKIEQILDYNDTYILDDPFMPTRTSNDPRKLLTIEEWQQDLAALPQSIVLGKARSC